MDRYWVAVAVTVMFSALGVVGDYFLKRASGTANPFATWVFYVGFGVYASTAFGWLFVMRHLKLATISAVYSVSMILMLTTIGVVSFGERLSTQEVIGLVLAIASLVMLLRFG